MLHNRLIITLAAILLVAGAALTPAHAEEYPGWNLVGGDYETFALAATMDAWDQCVFACEQDIHCMAATLIEQGDGLECRLKVKGYDVEQDPAAKSYVKNLYISAALGVNRAGAEYVNYVLFPPDNGIDKCREYCQNDANCVAFTYRGAGNGNTVCGLSNSVSSPSNENGVSTGFIYERMSFFPYTQGTDTAANTAATDAATLRGIGTATAPYASLPGYDAPGGDYFNFFLSVDDYQLCQDACINDMSCTAFTYVDPGVQGQFGRCWLKNQVLSVVPNPDTHTGIIGNHPALDALGFGS